MTGVQTCALPISLVQAADILTWLEEHPEVKIEKELGVLKNLNEESNPVVVLVK